MFLEVSVGTAYRCNVDNKCDVFCARDDARVVAGLAMLMSRHIAPPDGFLFYVTV